MQKLSKERFSNKAANHFGSGWAWLIINGAGELEVTDTHDQICPLSLGHKPILTIDVWEHAYYLKFRNARPKWIEAWWNVVDWDTANDRYEAAK